MAMSGHASEYRIIPVPAHHERTCSEERAKEMTFVRDLFRRLSRALDTRERVHVDERSLVGDQGEQYVARIIADYVNKQGGTWLRGPLLFPTPTRSGYPQGEKDFLVYTEGNLFCVEVKRWRGRVFYRDGAGDAELLREKLRNHGEALFLDSQKDPLRGTRWFISALKEQTSRAERRFGGLKLIPVVAFVRFHDTDISAIHSMQGGMIYAEELPQLFTWHRHPQFAQRPSQWIMHTVQYLIPSWDWVVTTRNEMVGGILTDQQLRFRNRDGHMQNLSFSSIQSIRWMRGGFSPYDEMQVFFTDGSHQTLYPTSGALAIQRYDERYTFKMRNVQELIVGISNKLR